MLSDATGSTAESVVRSALVQFAGADPCLKRFPFVRTAEQVNEIIAGRGEQECVVVYLFVDSELSTTTAEICAENGLKAIDLLSPMMGMISTAFQSDPERQTIMPFLPDKFFELATAIEYTLNHDDGKGIETLGEADVIILGISRTGKTPTSIFLGCRKIKAANVPIVNGMELPPIVRQVTVPKVGFRVSLERQLKLRAERNQRMGARIPGYSDQKSVFAEIEHCEKVFRSVPGIRTIDVSAMAVQEVADWIARNVL